MGCCVDRNASRERGIARRERFLVTLVELGSVADALRSVGVSESAYEKWRQRIPDFKERVDAARVASGGVQDEWSGSFADFRFKYFGHLSPWFHLKAIDAYEHTPSGNVTLIL